MIKITDLRDISPSKRTQIFRCLEDLLTFKDSDGKLTPIITGYNWYTTIPKSDCVITFANIHETEAYKSDMLRSLAEFGYDQNYVLEYIREKAGAFLHDLEFRIRDNKGEVLAGLRIKNIKTGKYLRLNQFLEPLINYPSFKEMDGYLISEDQGWELDMPFYNREELFMFVNLFLRKSGLYLYNPDGGIIKETDDERKSRSPWSDAYETPVLLLGKIALKYIHELPYFTQVTKFSLREGSNEISFVIHRNLGLLRCLPHYKLLLELGFSEESCLGNNTFIIEYVDKKR